MNRALMVRYLDSERAVTLVQCPTSRSVYKEERYHNKGGEGERDVAHFFCFLKQNFHVTRLMTYLS